MRFAKPLLLALCITTLAVAPAHAAAGDIFVYYGSGGWTSSTYTRFAAAAGQNLETDTILPESLAETPCVILPVNTTTFTAADAAALGSYVESGGTLIAAAEYSGSARTAAIGVMNDLSASLGSGLSVVAASIDIGSNTTTNIDADPLTAEVTSFKYAAGSEVTATGAARTLIRFRSAPTKAIIGAETIGLGTFVLAGDANWLNDFSSDAYSNAAIHNPRFAKNLCGGVSATLEANPALIDADAMRTYVMMSATLTRSSTGAPIAGGTVRFSAGDAGCEATTDAEGSASCGFVVETVQVALAGGRYNATFDGDGDHRPSAAEGHLVRVLGADLP